MKRVALLAALAALAVPTPALALDDDREKRRTTVTREQAVRIAAGYGMVRVTEVERDDGGWEVEGRDHRGRKLEVKIDRRGRVVKIERDDD
ncbi:PepSY domain-containing protein [Leptolyngbya sp. 15MV]|nr:PepSY domain-containing protein [Leptolyngbya sp. 15MV]